MSRAPDRQPARSRAQPWPLTVEAGSQALGFAPWPANAAALVGTELRLVQRRIYGLHLGLGLGFVRQPGFAHALLLDTPLVQRIQAPFGLYADVDLALGAQASRVPGVVHRPADQGGLEPRRAPVHVAARAGLGLALGFDFGARDRAPVRVFLRYRQVAVAPFMLGNGLPAMGAASLTGGVAVDLGRRSAKR